MVSGFQGMVVFYMEGNAGRYAGRQSRRIYNGICYGNYGVSTKIIQASASFAGMVIGIFVSIFVIKMLLNAEFKTFRIRVEKKDTSDMNP